MVQLWWWFRILRFLNAYINDHFLPLKWKGMQHMNSSRAVKCCSTKPSTTRYQGPKRSPLSLFGDKLSDLKKTIGLNYSILFSFLQRCGMSPSTPPSSCRRLTSTPSSTSRTRTSSGGSTRSRSQVRPVSLLFILVFLVQGVFQVQLAELVKA